MYSAIFYEKKKHGTKNFPVAYYYVDPSHPQYYMSFHWHTEWELIRVKKGTLVLYVDEQEFHAEEGDVLLIRDSMLHGGAVATGVYECLVFDFYGLFHDMLPVKEFVRPFYRMNYMTEVLYQTKKWPEICEIAAKAMDINYELYSKNEAVMDGKGYKELMTIGCLNLLFASILKNGLYEENTSELQQSKRKIDRVKNVLEYIEHHYQTQITLNELAIVAGMNAKYFCKAFKEVTMQSPMEYVIFYRLEEAVRLLASTDLSVTEVAMECGFNDCSYFIRAFKKQKKITPNQFRKMNRQSPFLE